MLLSQSLGAEGNVAWGSAGGQVWTSQWEWGAGQGAVLGDEKDDDKNDILDSSSNNWIDHALSFSDISKRWRGQGEGEFICVAEP